MEKKLFEITECKAVEEDNNNTFLYGYANNKNVLDAHGDIATGDKVYDLARYQKNPVLLVDHQNSASMVAGKMVEIDEDNRGLRFKAKLFTSAPNPLVKHAVDAAKEGFLKGLSIGGIWEYDKKDKNKETRKLLGAKIHEISLVGVGSNPSSVVDLVSSKKLEGVAGEVDILQKALKKSIETYKETKSRVAIKTIRKLALKINELKKGD